MIGAPFSVAAWALRNGVTLAAMQELRLGLEAEAVALGAPAPPDGLEAYTQSQVRLEAPRKGVLLFRNNVGVLKDETGRPVRYGLANDSAAVNAKIKSSDLIGIRPVTIEPHHMGQVIGQFVARECKRAGWTYRDNPREQAQAAFIHLVQLKGGDAAFTTGPGSL